MAAFPAGQWAIRSWGYCQKDQWPPYHIWNGLPPQQWPGSACGWCCIGTYACLVVRILPLSIEYYQVHCWPAYSKHYWCCTSWCSPAVRMSYNMYSSHIWCCTYAICASTNIIKGRCGYSCRQGHNPSCISTYDVFCSCMKQLFNEVENWRKQSSFQC